MGDLSRLPLFSAGIASRQHALEEIAVRFEYPRLLWLLLVVVPALVGFFWWSARQRRRLMDQFVSPRLLGQLLSGISAQHQKLRASLTIAAAALLVIALARPQWGFDWEEVRQRGLDIVIAIDTSRSMLAEDVSPNRLARAKLAALDLRKLAKADRMGLVAFAGTAFLQCPLSSDDEAFRQSVNELNVNIIPQGGTAVAEAIQSARTAFKDKSDNHKVLVLFTDGEDHDGQALDAAKEAAKEGVRIFTIGVGTPNGEQLRTTDARGRSDYIKDEGGNPVVSRLDEQLLTGIAKATEGFYLMLGGANTMDILYQRGLVPLPKAEFAARQIKRYHERFQWAIFFAILLLVTEMFIPERTKVVRKPASAPELTKAAALLLLFFLPNALMGASASRALKDYTSGKYQRAFHQFQDLLAKKPNDPRLNFNAGDAAFQAGLYDYALRHFNSSLATEDLKLQQRGFYNLGNTHFRMGEEEKDQAKIKSNWEEALTSYESALKLDPNDADAKYNLELVKKKLEELKQQQQQQQQQNKDNQDQQKDKSDDQKDQQQQQQQNKQDQQKQEEQKKREEQKKQQEQQQQQQQQEQQQSKKPDEKKDESQQQQPQPGNEDKKEEQEGQEANPVKRIQMTPQQAIRLLEAAKNDERTMIFIPPMKTNRTDRAFKDW
jgi:Ca-activated chloride channel homolog